MNLVGNYEQYQLFDQFVRFTEPPEERIVIPLVSFGYFFSQTKVDMKATVVLSLIYAAVVGQPSKARPY